MNEPSPRPAPGLSHSLGPGIIAAAAFACADVLGKVVFAAGGDVLTLLSCRSVVGLAVHRGVAADGRQAGGVSRRASDGSRVGLGLLFAATVFGLFEAIDLMDVPTAILAYFVYPLITGLVAALTGLERLGWRGGAAAIVAFIGLALMIGAHPGEIALHRRLVLVRRGGEPGRDAAHHPRAPGESRCAAHHLVFAVVVDRALRRHLAGDADLESAAHRCSAGRRSPASA